MAASSRLVFALALVACGGDRPPIATTTSPPPVSDQVLVATPVVDAGAAPDAPDAPPDPDRDHDWILNECDQCPDEPEMYQGIADRDGCPDRSILYVATPLGPYSVGFAKRSARPDRSLATVAQAIAKQLADRQWDGVVLSGCTDPNEPEALRAQRVDVLSKAVQKAGVPADVITIAETPCGGVMTESAVHHRFAAAAPRVYAPATIGCPPAR